MTPDSINLEQADGGGAPQAMPLPAPKPTVDGGGLGLEALLNEYDRANGKPAALATEQPMGAVAERQPEDQVAATDLPGLLKQAEAEVALIPDDDGVTRTIGRGKLAVLTGAVAAAQAEIAEFRNKADFGAILSKANEAVEGLPVPADFAERWIMSETLKNPALRKAFDNRNSSPQAAAWLASRVKRAMGDLHKAATAFPDRQATEDRAAVTAAMRGATSEPPPRRPPDYNSMTNNEFRNEFAKLGITSSI